MSIEIGKIYTEDKFRYYFVTGKGYMEKEKVVYFYHLQNPNKRDWDFEDTFEKMVTKVSP